MNIALLGYGRMGKAIEKIALDRGHQIVLRIDSTNRALLETAPETNIDVAIDFSLPHTAVHNISWCINHHIPVISGTTGWLDHKAEIDQLCIEKQGAFIYASNFSLGVNLFFELNKKLAQMMAPYSDYDTRVHEIHHTKKLDAPSGTAISIAEGILENLSQKESWVSETQHKDSELLITAERIDPVPGTHSVHYDSEIDSIEIKHTAHNRQGFALGAVIAAEWIKDRQGLFSMKDVLFG